MGRDEKRLAWLLAVVLGMWVTESWHGVGPAWTGLAASVIVMLPRIGFITGEEFSAGVNMRTCIYVAGILGSGDRGDANRYRNGGGRGVAPHYAAGCS